MKRTMPFRTLTTSKVLALSVGTSGFSQSVGSTPGFIPHKRVHRGSGQSLAPAEKPRGKSLTEDVLDGVRSKKIATQGISEYYPSE